MSWNRSVLIVAAVCLFASVAQAATIYVDDDAGPGGDGLTWATAYRFLQDALADAAASGGLVTEIRVAQGTYAPDQDEAGNVTPGDRAVSFELVEGLSLRGGYAGIGAVDPDDRDINAYETILSGDLLGNDGPDFLNNDENSYHVVTCSNTDDTAVMSGFTISAGNANGGSLSGGGFYIVDGHPTLVECHIVGCVANNNSGGGFIYQSSEPTLLRCTFRGNAVIGPGPGGAAGGGLGILDTTTDASTTLVDCVFRDNSVGEDETGAVGGAVAIDANPSFIGCLFEANAATGPTRAWGGAVFIQGHDSQPVFVDCILTNNDAVAVAAASGLEARGGGIYNQGSPIMINCTFTRNSAAEGGAVWHDPDDIPTLTNCILWGDIPDEIDGSGIPNVSYSDVEGGIPGPGNIDADPIFVDPDNGDFRLSAGSPCIDAGDNTAVPDGIDIDLDGNPRFVDDPDSPDCWQDPGTCGDPPVVDMGAYEFQGLPCPWDLDGDSNVFVTDLLLLLANWGPCAGCPADFNNDGFVTVADLLALIANFGPCPGAPCVWDVTGDGVVDNADLQQVLDNFGPCAGCPEDVNGDGFVNGQDAAAVATHFGPCP
ncbi:MAG: right-handed parallel beta-helix repeat-containing protein [Planctomycetota bacterium]|jgi:parallel beta-helix repeat protein